ncbi:MAG: hypothetical protein J6K89_08490 [Oscillospiraceae bacterium]|nr:hypothetical protein [Oscillospiraceae bacterium]
MKRMVCVFLLCALLFQLVPYTVPKARAARYTDAQWQELLDKWQRYLCGDESVDWEDPEIRKILGGTNAAGVSVSGISFYGGNSWTQLEKNRDNPDRVIGDTPVIVSTPSSVMGDQFVHLWRMARAYATKNTVYSYLNQSGQPESVTLYHNAQLRSAIFYGLKKASNYFTWDRWWEQINHSTATDTYNWWDWAYNAELHIGQTLIALQPYRTAEEAAIATTLMDTSLRLMDRIRPNVSPYGDQSTYEYRRTRLNVCSMIAALTKNENLMEETRTNLENFMVSDQTLFDGVKTDGSYVCHLYFSMEGTYGRDVLIERIIDIYAVLAGTAFEPDSPDKINQFNWIMDTFAPVMHNGVLMSMCNGREPALGLSAGAHVISAAVQLIGCFGEKEDLQLKQFIRQIVVQDTAEETQKAYSRFAVALGEVNQVQILKSVVFDDVVPERTEAYAGMRYATDRAVQHRQNYTVGLAMSSNRIATHESIWGRNRYGWYTGDGALYVYNDNTTYNYDQYGDIYQRFANKYRIPGTTEEESTTRQPWCDRYHYLPGMTFTSDTATKTIIWEPKYHEDGMPVGSFVGGVEFDGKYIAAAMDFEAYNWDEKESAEEVALIHCYTSNDENLEKYKKHQVVDSNLKAQKSYFLFDDEIVCIGSDIDYSTTNSPINTYVDNRELRENTVGVTETVYGTEDIIVDGTLLDKVNSFSTPMHFTDPSWVYQENFGGYVFPKGGDVYVNKTFRQSSNDGNAANDDYNEYYLGINPTNTKISFFELWLSHGQKPVNETYSYIMLPEKTAEETQSYSANPDITVLEATDKLHVVKENTLGITAIVFWRAGSYGGITVDRPMIVMVQEQDGKYTISVSDPTQKLQSGRITINRSLTTLCADKEIAVSAGEKTTLAVDFSGLTGETVSATFATKTQPYLMFDFNSETSGKYANPTYGHYDYSNSKYWATGHIGGVEATIKNGTMTFPLATGYNAEGIPFSTTNIEPSDSVTNYAPSADNTKANVLSFDPENAEIFQIRFKLDNATLYGGQTPGVHLNYLPAGATKWSCAANTAETPNPWHESIMIKFSSSYLDGGSAEGQYVTLTASLDGKRFRSYDLIKGIMIGFSNLRGGSVTIDHIYIGPKTEELYFGFDDNSTRYHMGAYGGYDYDAENGAHWAVACSEKTKNHFYIDDQAGTLSLYVTEDFNGDSTKQYGPYVETSRISGSYPWTSQDLHPLTYTPEKAEVLQVRFRTEGVIADGIQSAVLIALYTAQKNDTVTRYADCTKVFTVQNGVYQTVTIPLGENFTKADAINSLGLRFRNLKPVDGAAAGKVEIDYIYVGTREAAPSVGLYFGFEDTEEDRLRYSMDTYGGTNFDVGNWSYSARTSAPVYDLSEGTMSVTLLPDASGALYMQSGPNLHKDFPLHYDPSDAEVAQLRFKLENFKKSGLPYVTLYYYEDANARRNEKDTLQKLCAHALSVESLTDGTYLTVTMPLTDAFRSAECIRSVRLNFSGMVSGDALGKITVDYLYIGTREGLPSRDHLYFDFTNTPDDQARYNSETYGYTNFDLAHNWAIPTIVCDRTIENGALTFAIDPSSRHDYHYAHTGAGYSLPLNYLPGDRDYCQVRVKIDQAVSTDGAGRGRFMLYYGVGESFTNGSNFDYIDFDLASRVDRGYFVLTFPLDSGSYIDAQRINCIRPQFALMKGTDATFSVDYIYIGTKDGLPIEDHILMDFDGSAEASLRYSGKTYSNTNLDVVDNWTRHALITQPTMTDGALSFAIDPSGNSPYHYIHCGRSFGKPLQFAPGAEDYCQVRIKIENGRSTVSSGIGRFMLYYGINDSGVANENFDYVDFDLASRSDHGCFVLTFPLDNPIYRGANQINSIRPQFSMIQSAEGVQAVFSIDYIYVGPWDARPTQDHILMDFSNSAEAAQRYQGKTYGSVNFDLAENWWYNTNIGDFCIQDGDLYFGISSESTANYHYIHSGKGLSMPLQYTPGTQDYCQIRLKVEDAVSTAGSGAGRVMLYYGINSEGVANNNFDYGDYPMAKHVDQGYFTLTFPLDNPIYTTANRINSIRVQFSQTKSAPNKNAHFSIDYLYIGTKDSLPTALHKVSFVNEDGSILATTTVHHGEGATYTAATPGKKYDGQYHYTFTGWDKDLSTILSDLTVKAQFKATAHSYSYSSEDSTHKAVCSCGYSKTEVHAWNKGTVTKEPTCTAAGVRTYTCTSCKATKTEAIAPTGHSYSYTKIDALTHLATCRDCNISTEDAHSYKDGYCVCGEPEDKESVEDATLKLNHSLNLASDISVNLLISKDLLEGFDMSGVYVESTIDSFVGNQSEGTTTLRMEPVLNGNYYYFTLRGLTAVQMNDRISSVLYGTKNGQPYHSPVDVYSIASYAYSQMNNPDRPEALKTLCADLLRYGGRAQIFKNYRTDALADANMTAVHRAYLSDMEAVTFGNTNKVLNDVDNAPITWAGKALDLESKVALKFVFDPSNYTGDLSKLSLRVSYTDIHGKPKTVALEDPELYNPDRMLYAFTLEALLAAELRSVVSVQILAEDAPASCTLQYSADTYGNNKTGALLELCKALFAYSDSAKVYFQHL